VNALRILHTADVHFEREHQEQALASLEALYAHGRDDGVDLWAIAGDLFGRAVANTAAAGFPRLVAILQRMLDLAPIVAVRGTPTHDIDGCYEALQEIKARFRFTLLGPRESSFLGPDGDVGGDAGARLLILGCPEPSKEWFLRDKEGLGRDEATQAVKDGMRQLLLGLGAIRKQYAALPCLMVYHGAVEGASLCNGQTLRPGELAIGREDLTLVGADYYALGHIHLAQQVGGLQAYYPGSAYPVNWGEVDQKGFNQVEIWPSGSPLMIMRIPFPHPPRRKLVKELTEDILDEEVRGFQVWVVHRVPKDVPFNNDTVLPLLMEAGALEGSRATVEIIPTETVRAGAIAEARGLPDKLAVYALNSGEALTEPQLMKAAFLESEVRALGRASEGLHVRIDRLRLRGAIGVWKGLGLDEIDLDLTAYDAGLIALVGANGRGKTTLIENMHPYPEMLTRAGTLQEHFRLKDSIRELYFTDERTGAQYRALIQIDGANASGRAEYHLFREGQPLTNGRKADYEQAIERLFGSLSLFVRSAFVSQKPPKGHPDLTDATKGEKKALFRELAGLDYLQAYSEAAREKAKVLEAETERDAGRIEAMQGQLAGRESLAADLALRRQELQAKSTELLGLESRGKSATASVEELRGKVERNREIEQRIRESENRQEKLRAEVDHVEAARTTYQAALAGRPAAEAALAEIEALKAEEGDLRGKQTEVLQQREQLQRDYLDKNRAAEDAVRKIEAAQAALDREVALLDQQKKAAIARVDELEVELSTTITCPKCEHKFHPDADTVRAKIAAQQEIAFEADKQIEAKQLAIEACKAAVAEIIIPVEPELPTFDDSRLREIAAKLKDCGEHIQRSLVRAADEAAVHIQEGERRKAQITQELAELGTQHDELAGKLLGPELEEAFAAGQKELADLEAEYRTCRDLVKTLEAVVRSLKIQLAELDQVAQELETLQQQVEGKQQDAADWRYLERATGPDGIQALELDAMGPGIAEVANRLLSAAYGSRFSVEFRTTRIGGAGSKKRQIEDFQIWILDSEHGSEQLLETLSGGEAVWIKRAIYDAFGIIRDRSTGQRFLTCFQDEADGALDPEARLAYFRMLEAAHLEAGRRHTIVITHSPEAQEQIPQRIRMEYLAAAAVSDVEVEAAR